MALLSTYIKSWWPRYKRKLNNMRQVLWVLSKTFYTAFYLQSALVLYQHLCELQVLASKLVLMLCVLFTAGSPSHLSDFPTYSLASNIETDVGKKSTGCLSLPFRNRLSCNKATQNKLSAKTKNKQAKKGFILISLLSFISYFIQSPQIPAGLASILGIHYIVSHRS